jgi:hypothetical protein
MSRRKLREASKKILIFDKERIILFRFSAGVAQLAEQLICNQQVAGSSPIASSRKVNV